MTIFHIVTLPDQATYDRPLSTGCIEQIKALSEGINVDIIDDNDD
jgi:hypothetical protein